MEKTIDLKNQYKLRQRYTAIWAFSEAVFGGILHAFKIPFTGFFLGGFAVVFLSLIRDVSSSKNDILKVTSIVIIIKFMFSPNTPFTAHLAVFMQGLFAFLVFSFINDRSISVFVLSFLSAIWSASQKILLTTLIFGMTFWYSIDEFTIYLSRIVGINLSENFSMSLILISAYFVLHLIGAIVFAIIAIRLPGFLKKNEDKIELMQKEFRKHQNFIEYENSTKNSKKKKWYSKPTRLILIIFLLIFAFISYIDPELSKIKFIDVLSMIVRAVILIYLWFKIVSPLLVKIFLRVLNKNSYLNYISDFTSLFPEFKGLILFSWKFNSSQPKAIRIKKFLEDVLLLLLK